MTDDDLNHACATLKRGGWTHHDTREDGTEIMVDSSDDMPKLADAILVLMQERDRLATRVDHLEYELAYGDCRE